MIRFLAAINSYDSFKFAGSIEEAGSTSAFGKASINSADESLNISESGDEKIGENEYSLLIDDDKFIEDVMKEVAKAKKSISFESFSFDGKVGKDFADLLIKKKKEGVDVKVVLDPTVQRMENLLKKDKEGYNLGQYLLANGVEYRPYPAKKLHGCITPAQHAKNLVIDDEIAYVGGSNIDIINCHDFNLKVEGPAAKNIGEFFKETWAVSEDQNSCEIGYLSDPSVTKDGKVNLYATTPSRSTCKPAIIKNIREAEDSIDILMYSFTDDDLEREIIAAKKRGVNVRVILDSGKDIVGVSTFGMPNKAAAFKFKKAGIPVKFYKNDNFDMMHGKVSIFDKKKLMLGSTNFIHHSFHGVHEYSAEVSDEKIVNQAHDQFEEDWNHHTQEIDLSGPVNRVLIGLVEMFDGILI